MRSDIFFRFFAGIPMDELDAFPLVPLGRWLFPVGIYLLTAGFWLGMDRKNRRFVVIRYGRIQKWWKAFFMKNILYGGIAAIVILFLTGITGLFLSEWLPKQPQMVIGVVVLWTIHGMVFMALFLLMDLTKMRRIAPSVLLFMEGITFLYGYRNRGAARFMFGTWGMYLQSDLHDASYGFPAAGVIAAEISCIAACYLAGGYMLKRKEAEGVS